MSPDSPVDVVVVSYNSNSSLRRCVEGLADVECLTVIIVDNASTDETVASISDLPVRILVLEENIGFGGGCNVGWRAGTSPHVLFLNPDAHMEAADVLQLSAFMTGTSAGAVAPRIVNSSGTTDWSLRRFPEVRSIFGQALFAHRWLRQADWVDEVIRDPVAYEEEGACDWASGACLLVRRESLERLQGFDEEFFMYCEDVDLCKRLWDRGEAVLYTPGVQCVHAGGASAPRSSLVETLARSRIRYAQKHFGPWRAAAYRAGVGLNALTHVLVGRGCRARLGHAHALRAVLRSSQA